MSHSTECTVTSSPKCPRPCAHCGYVARECNHCSFQRFVDTVRCFTVEDVCQICNISHELHYGQLLFKNDWISYHGYCPSNLGEYSMDATLAYDLYLKHI